MQDAITLLVSEIPLFDALNWREKSLIESLLLHRHLNPGDVVYEEGFHGQSVCFVVKGELEVSKQRNGEDALITTLGKGQSIGEMALIDGMIRSATVRSKTQAQVLILKRDDFNRLLEEQSAIGIKILKEIARMLSLKLRSTSDEFSKAVLSLA